MHRIIWRDKLDPKVTYCEEIWGSVAGFFSQLFKLSSALSVFATVMFDDKWHADRW
tara:strand:- start:168 stop:335 length:168 start_codon:yes stop_codon:yes gene_type:complete